MPCNKIPYTSKKLALAEGKRILANTGHRKNTSYKIKRFRAYECPYCGAWHLTSRKPYGRKQKAKLKRSSTC